MRRRLFIFLCTISALLSLCTTIIWIRSYWLSDRLKWERTWHRPTRSDRCIRWEMDTGCGSLLLARSELPDTSFNRDSLPGTSHVFWEPAEVDHLLQQCAAIPGSHIFCGFAVCRVVYPGSESDDLGLRGVILPFWSLILVTLLLPARWVQLRCRHRHRLRLNLCPTCSYDLRASQDRCPECGSPTPQITSNKKRITNND